MPRRVDHDERRRVIAQALCAIAAHDGFEAVSIGKVAAAAGMSKGLVQHYFSSRRSMVQFATGYLKDQVEQRVATRLAASGHSDSPIDELRTLLLALLPIEIATTDDTNAEGAKTEALAATALTFHAMKDAELAAQFRLGHHQLTTAVADHLMRAQIAGELLMELNPTSEAEILLSIVNGVGDAVVMGYNNADSAVAILDYHLRRLRAHGAPPGREE